MPERVGAGGTSHPATHSDSVVAVPIAVVFEVITAEIVYISLAVMLSTEFVSSVGRRKIEIVPPLRAAIERLIVVVFAITLICSTPSQVSVPPRVFGNRTASTIRVYPLNVVPLSTVSVTGASDAVYAEVDIRKYRGYTAVVSDPPRSALTDDRTNVVCELTITPVVSVRTVDTDAVSVVVTALVPTSMLCPAMSISVCSSLGHSCILERGLH